MPKKPERAKVDEQRAALERLLHRDPPPPPMRIEVRLSAPAPTAKQLAALGLDEESTALVRAVAKRQGELGRHLAADRSLAQRFVSDPAAALEAAGVPRATITAAKVAPPGFLGDRIRDVLIRIPGDDAAQAAPNAAVDLLAATFAAAHGDPAKQAELRTNPRPQVLAAAAAHPPVGVAAGSPALASLVIDVTNAVLRAAGVVPEPTAEGQSAPGSSVITMPVAGSQ